MAAGRFPLEDFFDRAFHVGNMNVILRAADINLPAFYPSIQDG